MLHFATKSLPFSRTWQVRTASPRRFLQTVAVQLDYYMSAQFAGIACALNTNLYETNGIKLEFLPTCPVGHELQRVREYANNNHTTPTIGSVEQNIFIPLLYNNTQTSLKLKAIAAMFDSSPLCLASLSSNNSNNTVVGAHEDTVSLL